MDVREKAWAHDDGSDPLRRSAWLADDHEILPDSFYDMKCSGCGRYVVEVSSFRDACGCVRDNHWKDIVRACSQHVAAQP